MSDTPRTTAATLTVAILEGEPIKMVPAVVSEEIERELAAARRLAEKYRNLSCDSQDEADATLLPWETTNPNEQ